MSKHKRRWYGRPNKPPENWHTPDRPAIRSVMVWLDDDPEEGAASPAGRGDAAQEVVVSLWVRDWMAVLKTLYLYGEAYGDRRWQRWRMAVRKQVLAAVRPHLDQPRVPAEVQLRLEDWRGVWRALRAICERRDERWQRWFGRLSQSMTAQITDQL